MKTGSYSPVSQLAFLLPSHDDINSLLDICGGRDDPKIISMERFVYRLAADIVASPNNPEQWYDMACVFGLMDMTQWKYLFVAHRIDPENTKYMQALAWALSRMGDHNQAISLVNKALSIADNDADRIRLIESKIMMERQFDVPMN